MNNTENDFRDQVRRIRDPESSIFDNLIKEKIDEKTHKGFCINFMSEIIDKIFNRIEKICIILWGTYFNEEDVAYLFRLPNPKGSGKETIKNYALRSKKVSYAKAGRNGLLFHRDDLDRLYKGLKSESVRDL